MTWTEEDAKRLMEKTWETHPPSKGPQILVRGSFEPFKSPVDGRIITTHRALEKHNKENEVVDSREFSQEYYEKKAKERAALFDENQNPNSDERKQVIHKVIGELSNAT